MIIVLMIIIRTMTGFIIIALILMMTEKKVTVKIKIEIAIISFYLNFFQILNRRLTKKNREGLKHLTKSVLYMYLPEEKVSYICIFLKKMI